MNNSSFFTADRATHLKIVVVTLLATVVVVVIGLNVRPQSDTANSAQIYRPAKAMVATDTTIPAEIR